MNILDWFDLGNIEHLKAYKQVREVGVWPVGFPPKNITFVPLHLSVIVCRMADRYAEEKLSESYYEDYSYYVGGEITCGRMPLKYGSWITAGRPA